MMELHYLTPEFAVAPQISLADLAEVARMGFRTLINNRPDAENGPDLAESKLRAAAEAAGLSYAYLPYTPGELTPELVAAFEAELAKAEAPVLAWCRTGTRSSHLWAMSEAGKRPVQEIVRIAAKAGYDHSGLVPLLQAKAGANPRGN